MGDYKEDRLARRRRGAENTTAIRGNAIGTKALEAAINVYWDVGTRLCSIVVGKGGSMPL